MDQRISSVDRVRSALAAQGVVAMSLKQFTESTATAADAAAAIGTSVGRIVKSLVFMAGEMPILVLASGPNRVDLHKLAQLVGYQPITRANAEQVRRATGYAIGGVPPFGYPEPVQAYMDRDLLTYDEVWAAGGTPSTVFPIRPDDLLRVTGAEVAEVAART